MSGEVYYHRWRDSASGYPSLDGSVDTGICVVGAGFAGLSCALQLLQSGAGPVTLIDRGHVAYGASGRNGGFVFGGYSLDEKALVKAVGLDQARSLYRLTLDGVDLVKHRIQSLNIECDANPAGVLWANWFNDDRVLKEKQAYLSEQFDVSWRYIDQEALASDLQTTRYRGGLIEDNAIHFHPYRYAAALAREIARLGGQIHDNTMMTGLDRQGDRVHVKTPHGLIKADRVVLCGGGYQQRADHSPISHALMPIATFVMVTEPIPDQIEQLMKTPWAVYDTRFAFDYYRPLPDGRLLWGGRIEAFDSSRESIERKLRSDLAKVFPQLKTVQVDAVWSGNMGYSRHQMPQLGCLDEQVWYAQAFGGHGVSTSNMGGMLIARALAEGDETYRLFEPFGLTQTYGFAGRMAAQLNYWYLQTRDRIKETLQ